jgi:hypothetical protein
VARGSVAGRSRRRLERRVGGAGLWPKDELWRSGNPGLLSVILGVHGRWPTLRKPTEEGGGGGTPLPSLDIWWFGLQPGARGRGVYGGPLGRLRRRWDGVAVADDGEFGGDRREQSRGGRVRTSAMRRQSAKMSAPLGHGWAL